MRPVLKWIVGFGLALALGCSAELPEPIAGPGACTVVIGTRFDASATGSISGKVTWAGSIPEVRPYEVRSWTTEPVGQPRPFRPNPHAPVIDPATKGVAGAVVFLRGVDPPASRPWDHSPVVVEHRDRLLHVVQGETRSNVGWVRRGDRIQMVSEEAAFNALHASGAAYFTLTFPEPGRPLHRQLANLGHVELSSNAGWYWMRAHLFVVDHPYYARTDGAGRFALRDVPAGRYRLVCWMPNWNESSHDRDPESSLVTRVVFQPPVEMEHEIVVESGMDARADFSVEIGFFKR